MAVRNINETKNSIIEGEIRGQALFDYLTERCAGSDVWLSEDASGIVPAIQYDSSSDQLIGMVLPMDKFGCPQKYESTACNEDEIRKFVQYPKSTLVYVVMATPLKEGVPPFLLQMFGTNNTFTTANVVHRWNFIINDLKRYINLIPFIYFKSQLKHTVFFK